MLNEILSKYNISAEMKYGEMREKVIRKNYYDLRKEEMESENKLRRMRSWMDSKGANGMRLIKF